MTTNINPDTGIAYGYISADALDSETVTELMFGRQARDLTYAEAWQEFGARTKQDWLQTGGTEDDFDEEAHRDRFNDDYEAEEPTIEGEIEIPQHGNFPVGWVRYRSSWLGGALNFWIFDSPCVTQSARRASPCVPNAGILDTCDGDVTAYDVPADWRYQG